jgi:ubiquinol oxidase
MKAKLEMLTLDAKQVWKNENARFAVNPPTAPWYIKAAYFSLCFILDLVYEGRPIQRFWVLEEVARMPYFAYISMLHLYESLGWWRAGAALRKVHFAEEWNELHHLQVWLAP